MATVKSLVSGFVGYVVDGSHRETQLETGQEFDADAVIVLARPDLFTAPQSSAIATTRKVAGK